MEPAQPEPVKVSQAEKKAAKAKLVLAGRYQWVAKLLADGKRDRAVAYAKTYSLDMAAMLAPAVPVPVAEPVPANVPAQPLSQLTIITVSPGTVHLVNGWPMEAEIEVVRHCRNRKLVAGVLQDGREVSLYNEGSRPWSIHLKVKARLVDAQGDPVYEAVKQAK